jgi:hypothetical protein
MPTNEFAQALVKAQATQDHHAEAAVFRRYMRKYSRAGRQHADTPLARRLLDRVCFGVTDCWHWTGADNGRGGYGRMTYEGVSQPAHRLAYRAFVGEIPDGLYVLHTCDNRACINPEHLWLGTYSDNIRDAWAKGRHPGRTGKKGNNR